MGRFQRSAAPLAAAFLLAFAASASGAESADPVPRFVSLKTEGANGRRGPGLEHRIDWIYQRAGLPLQVTGESGPWRRVQDPSGAQVWMHESNLQSRRTVMVQSNADLTLRSAPGGGGRTVARLAPGVVAAVTACRGDWRRLSIAGRVGWAPSSALWGGEDCRGL